MHPNRSHPPLPDIPEIVRGPVPLDALAVPQRATSQPAAATHLS